jgi:hypothetical protein
MENRSSNNWMIHSNWTEDGKRMHLVGLLEGKKLSSKKIKECAEKLEEANKLEKSSKGNRSPVWIQKTELDDDKYLYSIFFARENPILTLNEAKKIKLGECFAGMTFKTYELDKNDREKFTDLFLYIKKITSGSLVKKGYAKTLKKLHNNKSQSGGYVKLSNGQTRKVRTYKNGNKYILLNGKKVRV